MIKYWKQRYFQLVNTGYLHIFDHPNGHLLKKVSVSQQHTILQVSNLYFIMVLSKYYGFLRYLIWFEHVVLLI